MRLGEDAEAGFCARKGDIEKTAFFGEGLGVEVDARVERGVEIGVCVDEGEGPLGDVGEDGEVGFAAFVAVDGGDVEAVLIGFAQVAEQFVFDIRQGQAVESVGTG